MTAREVVRLAGIAAAAAGTAVVLQRTTEATVEATSPSWVRDNHRGEQVWLGEGPVAAAATVAALALVPEPRARAAATLAVLGGAVVGRYDDRHGSSGDRGLRGHLAALRSGRVTTGVAKVVGLGAVGVGSAALVTASRRPADLLLGGAVVAGAANALNLFDVRPGRALKVALLAAAPQLRAPGGPLAAAAAGAAAAELPADLGERSMLGDCGANAMGALLGLAAVAGAPTRRLRWQAAALAALTLASEAVSFTQVIDGVPPLRSLDRLGRRPAP